MQIAALRAEPEDRVADQLPGPVVGHVASPARLEELDAALAQLGVAGQHVLAVGARPQRDDVRVLEQEELVGDLAGCAAAHQAGLEVEGARVLDQPEAGDLQGRGLRFGRGGGGAAVGLRRRGGPSRLRGRAAGR